MRCSTHPGRGGGQLRGLHARWPSAVHRTATRLGKRVQALGGAKNHLVVMPDADLDAATDALIGSAYGSAGERCMAISVAVAVGEVADAAGRAARAAGARAARAARGRTLRWRWARSSPREHLDRVRALPRRGRDGRCALVVDGRGHPRSPERRRASSSAAVSSTGSRPEMRIYREEIFGPVLAVVRVRTLDEALALVDAHPYRQRDCHLHPIGRGGTRVHHPRATAGWWASTCPSRCPWPSTASAAGSARSSATTRCTARRACASTLA